MKLKILLKPSFEVFYIVGTFILTWSLLFLFAINSTNSKYSHLVRDYSVYLQKSKLVELSALDAISNLKAWKAQFQPNRSMFDLLENNQTKEICVGVMSKTRIGSNINFAAQSIMAILTRTQLRLQDRVVVRVFNTEEVPEKNTFLTNDLNNLVQVCIRKL